MSGLVGDSRRHIFSWRGSLTLIACIYVTYNFGNIYAMKSKKKTKHDLFCHCTAFETTVSIVCHEVTATSIHILCMTIGAHILQLFVQCIG